MTIEKLKKHPKSNRDITWHNATHVAIRGRAILANALISRVSSREKRQPEESDEPGKREAPERKGGEGGGRIGRICFRTIFSVPPCKGVGRQE